MRRHVRQFGWQAVRFRTEQPRGRPGQVGVVEADLAVDGGGQHSQAGVAQRADDRCAASGSDTTGIEKMLPADARRHFPL